MARHINVTRLAESRALVTIICVGSLTSFDELGRWLVGKQDKVLAGSNDHTKKYADQQSTDLIEHLT